MNAELERAIWAVDRELAGSLELTTMFDQTKQAVVLENAEFLRYRSNLERDLDPAVFATVASLYARLPDAEAAMERRGPANTLKDADRLIVESWEGDAREVQRVLRAVLAPPPVVPSPSVPPRVGVLGRLGRFFRRT